MHISQTMQYNRSMRQRPRLHVDTQNPDLANLYEWTWNLRMASGAWIDPLLWHMALDPAYPDCRLQEFGANTRVCWGPTEPQSHRRPWPPCPRCTDRQWLQAAAGASTCPTSPSPGPVRATYSSYYITSSLYPGRPPAPHTVHTVVGRGRAVAGHPGYESPRFLLL